VARIAFRPSRATPVRATAATNRYLVETNADPRPFVRTARPEYLLEEVRHGHQALDAIH
jgi:hypothetical protein